MSQRKTILIIFIVILVAINIWRWWPSSGSPEKIAKSHSGNTSYRAEDFQVRMLAKAEKQPKNGRDLFRPKVKKLVKQRKKPKGPPPKTPEQLAEEAARAELATIKCIGIAFKDGKGKAFMSIGGQTQLVAEGGRIGSRFIVVKITTDKVEVHDPSTKVTGQIPVAGR